MGMRDLVTAMSTPHATCAAERQLRGLIGFLVFAVTALAAVELSEAVTFNPGDVLVVDHSCCGGAGGVIRVNPSDGSQTIVSSGDNFVAPVGIAIAANGDLLVVDPSCCGGQGGIILVNPADGSQTIVSSGD